MNKTSKSCIISLILGITGIFAYAHKLASSVNLHRFTHFLDFPSGSIFANCLLGKHPQSPLNGICDTGYTIFQSFCKNKFFLFYLYSKKVIIAIMLNMAYPPSVKSMQSSLSYLPLTGAWHAPVISPKEKLSIGSSVELHVHPGNADGLLLVLPV